MRDTSFWKAIYTYFIHKNKAQSINKFLENFGFAEV